MANRRPGRCPKCKSTNIAVVQRNCNHSAFNGYHRTYSDYSAVSCKDCRNHWRTKADYVASLPDYDRDEFCRS